VEREKHNIRRSASDGGAGKKWEKGEMREFFGKSFKVWEK